MNGRTDPVAPSPAALPVAEPGPIVAAPTPAVKKTKAPRWRDPDSWEAIPLPPAEAGAPKEGREVIRAQLALLPGKPGVYRMLDAKGQVLYVGKAKNLVKRVSSYARSHGLSTRIRRMVRQTVALEIITTHTEVEALLLESNLIKRLKPRFNITLRDDKSFPYILITGDHAWAQIAKHRGARNRQGEYFGPFASAGAVNRTIAALQRAFPLRSCSDSVFESRTRPCLQYQIKRCTAPCVGRIARPDYDALVDEVREFLRGQSQTIQKKLSERMQAASGALDYETAAVYRDRIRALTAIQARQGINTGAVGDADVIAAHQEAGQTCVQVFFFRSGQNFGNRAYFPRHERGVPVGAVLQAFIGQFYADRPPPATVLLSHPVGQEALIAKALEVRAGGKVSIASPSRGARRTLIEHALQNAREALSRRLAESASQRKLLEGVAKLFGLENPPERIEVFDNSHVQGAHAVGSMIVAGPEGFAKNAYRKFNIREPGLEPGDDYGMMREVLTRRFKRLIKDDEDRSRGQWPELVLIDGGAGQLKAALDVFADLGVANVAVASIAKGPDRNAGREEFYLPGRTPFSLEPNDPVLYFLQRLRDEAHHFAIAAHRRKRSAAIGVSPLDVVPGIGAKRKRALLHHFGSAKAVEQAGLADLEKVPGISHAVAQVIYDHFHGSG